MDSNLPVKKIIPRPDYIGELDRHRKLPDLIKIITGVRRCGKSTILKMYQEKLLDEGIDEKQILSINMEDFTNRHLRDGAKLHQHVEDNAVKNKMNYVFLDEVQSVSDFGEVINSLRLRENMDLYVTGSNSSLLSGKLPKILGGRYIQIHMFPLSFKEYFDGYPSEHKIPLETIFQDYIENSSFPEALVYCHNLTMFSNITSYPGNDQFSIPVHSWNRQGVQEYLSHIYESIIMRDVMQNDNIKELPQLTRVINFLFSSIGSETSINNMMGVINNEFKLKTDDKKIYAPMLEKYVQALLDCFIFYKAEKHYISGKELLRTNAKYYAVDAGLRYYLLGGTMETDSGHILENIVYLELLRRGYKTSIGKIGDKEIDFIAQKPGGRTEYYQVSQSVISEETLKRELAPLQAIKDNYPKFLLTRDYNSNNYNGIRHINVLDWLLGNERTL